MSLLHAEDIANVVFYTASLPAHVCINELEITCLAQANAYYLFKETCKAVREYGSMGVWEYGPLSVERQIGSNV